MNADLIRINQGSGLIRQEPLSEASQLNQWIFSKIHPWLKGNMLELSSGTGQISELLIREGLQMRLSDSNENYRRLLHSKFQGNRAVLGIHEIDINKKDFDKAYSNKLGKLDTVLMLNITEHNPASQEALINAKKLLRAEGHFILLFPASTALYAESDLAFSEWRMRNRQSIQKLLGRDMRILKIKLFNVSGILGLYLSGSKFIQHHSPEEQLKLYHKKVPLFRTSDEILFNRIGLSSVVIARKR